MLSMWPCQNISHIQDESFTAFFNPTHKTKTETTDKWETTLVPIAIHLHQSNSLANEQQMLGRAPGPNKLSSQSTLEC
jgi:hypothetical protein